MNTDLNEFSFGLDSLVIFRGLLKNETVKALVRLLTECSGEDTGEKIKAYSEFVYQLYKKSENLTDFMLELVLEDENSYIIRHAEKKHVDSLMTECALNELKVIQKVAYLTPEQICSEIDYHGFLPRWKNSATDFVAEYQKRIDNINYCGYGLYSKYNIQFPFVEYILPPWVLFVKFNET